jgi:hypothetical protein
MSTFDENIVITTVVTYNRFEIRNIKIEFQELAKVDCLLFQIEPATAPLNEIIEIPVETYTQWQYDQTQIINYCKTYLQNKYAGNPDSPY